MSDSSINLTDGKHAYAKRVQEVVCYLYYESFLREEEVSGETRT
jgi:hypothetical protein